MQAATRRPGSGRKWCQPDSEGQHFSRRHISVTPVGELSWLPPHDLSSVCKADVRPARRLVNVVGFQPYKLTREDRLGPCRRRLKRVPATKHRKGLARPPAEPFFDVQSTKPNSRCIPPRPETRHLVHALPPNRPGRGIIGHHRRAQATHLALPAKRPRSGPSCSKNTRRRLRRNCMVRRYVKKHRLLLFWLVVDNCRMRPRTSWPDRERPGDGSIWKVLHPLHGGIG